MISFLKRLFKKPEQMSNPKPQEDERFEDWFDRQGFKHFSGKEIARYFSAVRYGTKNSYPPRELWENFLPTMKLVDDLRGVLGVPVRVTSSYRSPAYNLVVGGAKSSKHKLFNAADIQADGATPHEMLKVLASWRKQGKFAGGLGLYPTFVHVDTRGYNASW